MNTIVNITDFRNNIGTYIDKVIYNKDSFLLKKGKKVVAKVSTYTEEKPEMTAKEALTELAGLWKDIDLKKYKNALKRIDEAGKRDTQKLFKMMNS